MAEPLLATLAERGESLVVAALPWVAPAFAAMPEVEDVELPFAAWPARLEGAPTHRALVAGPVRCRLRAAEFDQVGAVALAGANSRARRLSGEGRPCCSIAACRMPPGRPPMVAVLRRSRRAPASTRRCATAPPLEPTHVDAALAAATFGAGLLGFAPGRRIRSGQALAGGALRSSWRARCTRPTAPPIALLGSPGEAALCESIAAEAPGACQVLAGQDLAARRDGPDRRGARPGEQRLGPDACRRRFRRARRSPSSDRRARCTRHRSTIARACSG